MKKSVLALSAVALMATGCSSGITQAQFDQLSADVAASKQASQQALQAAQDAKAMSMRTDEKLNRMFRKAQMK